MSNVYFACIQGHQYILLFLEPVEERADVTIAAVRKGLLHYENDPITLSWNPSGILPKEIAQPSEYGLYVEAYVYRKSLWKWDLFQTYDNFIENSGTIQLVSFPSSPPNIKEPISIVVFRIVVNASLTLPELFHTLISNGKVSIWSYPIYMITDLDYRTKAPAFCKDWHSKNNQFILDGFFLSCPCQAEQARLEASEYTEMTSLFQVKLREFLHPGSATCFQTSARYHSQWSFKSVLNT